MWKKDLRTMLLLLFTMLIWAVVYNMLTSCTKTTQKIVTTLDTVFVAHSSKDSTYEGDFGHEKDFVSKVDTFVQVKTDTIIKTITKSDSVILKDSVYVREKGDSIYIYKEKWKERLIFMRDTLYKSRTDTLRQIVRDTVYKERTDTLKVIQFIERNDSSYQSKADKEKIIKEKRTFGWLKMLAFIIAIFFIFAILNKIKHKKA